MFFVAKAVGKRDALSLPLFQASLSGHVAHVGLPGSAHSGHMASADPSVNHLRPPLPCLGEECHIALASSCQSLSCWGAA